MAGERILVVDDEIFYRTFYHDALSAEGYIVQLAENGRIALSVLEKERFDLVIIDHPMEGMGGVQLLERIKKKDPLLPVLVAGPPNVEEALMALRRGAADYTHKPLGVEELKSSIRSVLDRARLLRQRVLSLSESFEQSRVLEVLRRGKEILLKLGEDQAVASLLDLALEQSRASRGFFLWKENGSSFTLRAHKGTIALQAPPPSVVLGKGAIGAILPYGSPALLKPMVPDDPDSCYLGKQSTLILPLEGREGILGGLVLTDKSSGESFTERDIRLLTPIATLVSLWLGRGKGGEATEKREPAREGLPDRPAFERLIDKEVKKSQRYRRSFSVILVNFEPLRDLLEKGLGLPPEEILEQLRGSLLNTIRGADTASLLENGEIGLLVPETDYQGAIAAARRIRHSIQGLPILKGLSLPTPFPLLFGIACFPEHGTSREILLNRAREGMRRSAESASRFENLWGYIDQLLAEARITAELIGALSGSRQRRGGEDFSTLPRDSDQLLPTGEYSKELQFVASWKDFQSFRQYIEDKILERLVGEGIFYVGLERPSALHQKLEKYHQMQENGIKVFLFAKEEWQEEGLKEIIPVATEDPALSDYSFLFYYGVSACYALVGRQREEEPMSGFFTTSDFLVNEIMKKIDETYL
ncbi:MAG: response regulator [candidate division NC10 bacterium]|nr:response regulator [candidate division NC10 bacterium]